MAGLRIAGLFAGIGGVELGLHASGHETVVFCEKDPAARAVLAHRFPRIELTKDIARLTALPPVDVVAAGFPCSDLSQAGRVKGLAGRQSGLIRHVFRLLHSAGPRPSWILIENVPFMLRLDRGRAMHHLTRWLDELGYRWAYRVVDTRAFGLPERRRRVLLLAGRDDDPRQVLFADDAAEPAWKRRQAPAYGFYWTEGNRGLGWAENAVPTLKGGSTLGIPSPPGVVTRDGRVGVIDLLDAERLQGFPSYWTSPGEWTTGRRGIRWRLVGNAVSVPVSRWIGRRLSRPREYATENEARVESGESWPDAAWGSDGKALRSHASAFPVKYTYNDLMAFLRNPLRPLSLKATTGFLTRLRASNLRVPEVLLTTLSDHRDLLERNETEA